MYAKPFLSHYNGAALRDLVGPVETQYMPEPFPCVPEVTCQSASYEETFTATARRSRLSVQVCISANECEDFDVQTAPITLEFEGCEPFTVTGGWDGMGDLVYCRTVELPDCLYDLDSSYSYDLLVYLGEDRENASVCELYLPQ